MWPRHFNPLCWYFLLKKSLRPWELLLNFCNSGSENFHFDCFVFLYISKISSLAVQIYQRYRVKVSSISQLAAVELQTGIQHGISEKIMLGTCRKGRSPGGSPWAHEKFVCLFCQGKGSGDLKWIVWALLNWPFCLIFIWYLFSFITAFVSGLRCLLAGKVWGTNSGWNQADCDLSHII